ncbi:purine nucleoside permease [Scheffersomyces coipomensis]|uniref:purine nucleoside permease n=1 Tax=Scheffersomyces coipomensis TaxID=1788519 RepID=UPI00315DE90D
MFLDHIASQLLVLLSVVRLSLSYPYQAQSILKHESKITPKIVIVSMFQPEEEAWTTKIDFKHNITVPGLSPMYPYFRCVKDYSICQFTTGEGEINAATSVAFLLSNAQLFDFSKSYWLLAGIGGGDPSKVTTGSVTFAKYAIQVGLQFQIDSRELIDSHPDWPAGYFSYGAQNPWDYPDSVYGTEIFEVNEKLRDRALLLSQNHGTTLNEGTEQNINLRQLYESPANNPPQILACDVTTSDNYFTGSILADYYNNLTTILSNGTANYCSSAQEENASLEAFIRMAKVGVIDFERIVIMRTISNFVKSPTSLHMDPIDFFLNYPKGGFQHALDNLYIGGWPFVEDVVNNWDSMYKEGHDFKPDNYIGDIFGTLGGKPNFGKDKYSIS